MQVNNGPLEITDGMGIVTNTGESGVVSSDSQTLHYHPTLNAYRVVLEDGRVKYVPVDAVDTVTESVDEAKRKAAKKRSKMKPGASEAGSDYQYASPTESEDDEEEAGDDEPDEDSITTTDDEKWYQYGKLYHRGDRASLKRKMDKDRFWPNVFSISDHGNAHLISGTRNWWKESVDEAQIDEAEESIEMIDILLEQIAQADDGDVVETLFVRLQEEWGTLREGIMGRIARGLARVDRDGVRNTVRKAVGRGIMRAGARMLGRDRKPGVRTSIARNSTTFASAPSRPSGKGWTKRSAARTCAKCTTRTLRRRCGRVPMTTATIWTPTTTNRISTRSPSAPP
jgi:hypothetical protein